MKQQTIDGLRKYVSEGGKFYLMRIEATDILELVAEVERLQSDKVRDNLIMTEAAQKMNGFRAEPADNILIMIEAAQKMKDLRTELAAERERAALICEGIRIYVTPEVATDTLLTLAVVRIRNGSQPI